MMNLSRRIALVAIMLVMAVAGAWAQPGGGRGPGREPGGRGGQDFERGPRPEMMLERCLGTLDLSQEQRDAIAAIKARLESATADTRAQIATLQESLRAAREAGNREEALAIMEQIKAAEETLAQAGRAAHEAILAALTDAQRASLAECMEKRPNVGDRGRHDAGRNDCWAQLELSDEQKAQLTNMRERFHAAHQELMAEIRGMHAELRAARRSGDTTAVARLRAAIAEKMTVLKTAQESLKEAMLGVLTPEQLAALEDCREERDDNPGRGGIINDTRVVPQLK